MLRGSILITLLCAGVSFAAEATPCRSNADCSITQFCDTESATSCNDAGVCTARGINVMCMNVCDPVCGCDGKSYDNECVAHKAGVSVAYVGACQVCADLAP